MGETGDGVKPQGHRAHAVHPDEPATGLHFLDVARLLEVLLKLRQTGSALVVIEHNLDVIKTADWIIDLGLEGDAAGGKIVAEGSPDRIITYLRQPHRAVLEK